MIFGWCSTAHVCIFQTHNHSVCIRPPLPVYTVEPQTATFSFKGSLDRITELKVWQSQLGFDGQSEVMFKKLTPVKVKSDHHVLYSTLVATQSARNLGPHKKDRLSSGDWNIVDWCELLQDLMVSYHRIVGGQKDHSITINKVFYLVHVSNERSKIKWRLVIITDITVLYGSLLSVCRLLIAHSHFTWTQMSLWPWQR